MSQVIALGRSANLHHPFCSKNKYRCRSRASSARTEVTSFIDLKRLQGSPAARSLAVDDIGRACQQHGSFQLVNHGIGPEIIQASLDVAVKFFELPMEEKRHLVSDDVTKPVRYSWSSGADVGGDQCAVSRFFLKHYAQPIQQWINLWPSNPSDYREMMGMYAKEVRRVAIEVTKAIMESLGLGPAYLQRMENGSQVIVVNGYPPCDHISSGRVLGFAPHSDYSIITVLLQSTGGLEAWDAKTKAWSSVEDVPGSLVVLVGNHLEVMSNGRYKSVLHRVAMKPEKVMRVSIASFHSLAMDDKVQVAEELVNEHCPKRYKDTSFKDFLRFLSDDKRTVEQGKSYLDTLKIDA